MAHRLLYHSSLGSRVLKKKTWRRLCRLALGGTATPSSAPLVVDVRVDRLRVGFSTDFHSSHPQGHEGRGSARAEDAQGIHTRVICHRVYFSIRRLGTLGLRVWGSGFRVEGSG